MADSRTMSGALDIYADRSFDAASRSGGWAFVVIDGDRHVHAAAGAMTGSSNNTFEVLSVIQAASWLEREAPTVAAVFWTDSAHVVEGCDRWQHIWRGNGWKRVRANLHERRRPIPDANATWKDAVNADRLARMGRRTSSSDWSQSGVIGKNVKDELQKALKLRNGCGQPNSLKTGPNMVASHIESLLLNVFENFQT